MYYIKTEKEGKVMFVPVKMAPSDEVMKAVADYLYTASNLGSLSGDVVPLLRLAFEREVHNGRN